MKTAWKAGDWCFFEAKLCFVKEVRDDEIILLTDGYFETSGRLGGQMLTLDRRLLAINEDFRSLRDRLHREGAPNLNYPDIVRWLVEKWLDACSAALSEDSTSIRKHYDEARELVNKAIERSKEIGREDSGHGFSLFRGGR